MDLRHLPEHLTAEERITERRMRIEQAYKTDLTVFRAENDKIGNADTHNCEQMFGHMPIPLGLAGPLTIHMSNRQSEDIILPLATTEGALIASVNRGCKAINAAGGGKIESSHYHGISRSLGFLSQRESTDIVNVIEKLWPKWKKIGEETSEHLRILRYDIDQLDAYTFLTIHCDTDEAMGMNMVTIAAQAIGEWIEQQEQQLRFVTVAGNVDSDKKPSKRTHDRGRGYDITAAVHLSHNVIERVLKTDASTLMRVAKTKLEGGSIIAGAIGSNLHAANMIAALYIATGQDCAHVVEGALADTKVEAWKDGVRISVRSPAILVGIRGGGTSLPAQKKALDLILKGMTHLSQREIHPCRKLAEIIGATVLAGEISLLASQANHTLATAHRLHARDAKENHRKTTGNNG